MDDIQRAVSLAKVAVLLAALLAGDRGVDKLEVELPFDKGIELAEVLDQPVTVAIV